MSEEKPKTFVELLDEIQNEQAEYLARVAVEAARSGRDGYKLELYEPIQAGAEKRSVLHFRPHTLRDVRLANNSDDELAASLCGLPNKEALEQLCSIDYQAVGQVLAGFHLRRAAGGPARKG